MDHYLLHGKLKTLQGNTDQLTAILIEASKLVSSAKGCKLYVICKDEHEPNMVFITEIWESKEDHDNSLKVEGVRELIMKAMPLLDGMPVKGQELEVLGGWGL